MVPGGRGAVLPGLPGPVPHHLGVDCAGHAVVQLHQCSSQFTTWEGSEVP